MLPLDTPFRYSFSKLEDKGQLLRDLVQFGDDCILIQNIFKTAVEIVAECIARIS